ncbi:MAG: hypothetical protein MJ051_05405 [Akkermansia sp.]|nr:hypothetical protein [Akkermansia sp.]
MKHFPLFKHLALACSLAAGAAVVSSCTSTPLPQTRAQQLAASTATVFSYNDSNSAATRVCNEAGPLPETAARALQMWLNESTVKPFSYAYPQYFVSVTCPKTGKQSVWGICSDGQGNLVGVLVPRNGVDAWDLPFIGNYKLYVCDTKQRKVLSDTIMESLSDAGYDTYRLEARKASGLTQEQYLISKPLTDAEKARIAELKAKEEAAAKAAEEAAKAAEEKKDEAPAADEEESPATPDTVTEDEDSDDDASSTDDAASSSSDDEGDADEEASSDDDDF